MNSIDTKIASGLRVPMLFLYLITNHLLSAMLALVFTNR